jgi:hypothetical protein
MNTSTDVGRIEIYKDGKDSKGRVRYILARYNSKNELLSEAYYSYKMLKFLGYK